MPGMIKGNCRHETAVDLVRTGSTFASPYPGLPPYAKGRVFKEMGRNSWVGCLRALLAVSG